jgi:hypothetical protein
MMRVFYGMNSGHAHRYQCRGDVQGECKGMCLGVGGVRVDRAAAGGLTSNGCYLELSHVETIPFLSK